MDLATTAHTHTKDRLSHHLIKQTVHQRTPCTVATPGGYHRTAPSATYVPRTLYHQSNNTLQSPDIHLFSSISHTDNSVDRENLQNKNDNSGFHQIDEGSNDRVNVNRPVGQYSNNMWRPWAVHLR